MLPININYGPSATLTLVDRYFRLLTSTGYMIKKVPIKNNNSITLYHSDVSK